MTEYSKDLWKRAENALDSAKALIKISPDDAASRAYYAVFHAVSAAFALQNKTFVKHAAVRAAVHREFIKTGLWPMDIGIAFDMIWELRDTGDYGGTMHVTEDEANQAVQTARQILEIIAGSCPELK
ncbi:MAG: HEPN domain-containing protein [Verrucomicrobia bacterium]|nr:HEPN domain-containing protein [Verrucomicrobiota bacterium]